MDKRIAKLKGHRLYRDLFILAGLIAVAPATWGAAKPTHKVIQARNLL